VKPPLHTGFINYVFICTGQGESIHVNRVSPANTLEKEKQCLLSYLRGTRHTMKYSRIDRIKRIVSQPGVVVGQLAEA
jgi:hypothetical protein